MRLPPVLRTRRTHRRLVIAAVLAVLCSFLISLVAQSQDGPDRNAQLKGKTREVTPVPNGTVDAGPVIFKPDSDNDGMPDEDEANNGTDPNDPSDADGDNDGDGLSNGDEVALGANPNATDSDGDGVSDAEEVRLGYDPTDPNNTPPAGATLTSLRVSPPSINISINSLLGQQPVQLRVTGVLSDATTVDLTGSPTLTYQSFDSNVVVVDDFGLVVGIGAGQTTVRVLSGTVFSDVPVAITTITPGPLSAMNIPGYANNVDVAGDYAYVAAGAAGLVVVNVSDRSAPVIVATLNTPGNANDVRVVGTTAYVADGSSGLQIIDISTPASPSILGSFNTPGDANDVVIRGTRAYVADGFAGLQIIDVSSSSAPTSLGSVDTPGTAWGVDVSGDWAVVADGASVRIIDAAVPATPTIAGSVAVPSGSALDVEVRNRFAYVATLAQGLQLVDFSVPSGPRIIAVAAAGSNLKDIALANRYAVGAELGFPNFLPIFDLGDPGSPTFVAVLNPSPLSTFRGTGLALTSQHIYMTGTSEPGNAGNGTSGNTGLFILAYQSAQTPMNDTAGIAPTVTINSPQSGQSATEGDPLQVAITATDDVNVALVQLIINGVVITEDGTAPYNITCSVPRGATSLAIEARAVDSAGNAATSPPVTINVLPDPPPTITFIVPEEGQVLYQQQQIFIAADANDNRNAQVAITINGSPQGNFSFFTVPFVSSLTFVATATDDFGQMASTTRIHSVVPDPPPAITIVSPVEGTELVQGQVVEFIADASDNILVNHVDFTIDGQVFTDSQSPFRHSYTIPAGTTSLFLEAAAVDNLGQRTTATRTFTVVTELGTTVTGQVLDTSAQPVSGATAKVGQLTALTGANGRFTIPNVPTAQGDILVRVTATIAGQSAANASVPTPRVPGGTTDVGVITLSISPTAPTAFALTNYDSDFVPDVFVGYPDRQSLIYSFNGSEFTPNANFLLPYGAVNSGANLDLNFGQQHQIFAQLAGRPGSVTDVTFDNGTMFAPITLATGLGGESEYTAVGLDTASSSSDLVGGFPNSSKPRNMPAAVVGSDRSVLAFLKNSGGTSLLVRFGDNSPEGFGAPLALPVDQSVPLRSLTVTDINNDGFVDVIVVKPDTGSGSKLVVYLRTSPSTFGSPVESPITVRATAPARGAVDFVFGSLSGDSNKDIAVLGDDRVRIYQGGGTGGFVFVRELIIPAGRIATGLTAFDVSADGRSDLIVTTRNTTTPTSKEVRVYLNTPSGVFLSPTINTYVAPINAGDTRIGIGKWEGAFNRFDAVVVDGETVKLILDVGPASGGGS